MEVPSGSKNLDIKPYATSGVRTDRTVSPVLSNDVDAQAGFDAKYGITQNVTLDFNLKTDSG